MTNAPKAPSVFLFIALVVTSGRGAEEIEYRENIQYGTGGGKPLTLHLAYPKQASDTPRPAVVCIHGGGWAGGSKNRWIGEVKELAGKGFVAVTVSYRLVPTAYFPAPIEDCKCAVRWLRAHAKEYGIDPTRIGAMGDSAGGHLSMMLGVMDPKDGLEGTGGWQDQSSKVQAVVAYYGPVNFLVEYPEQSRGILKNFLQGTLKEKEADYRRASPLTYVSAGDAPMLLFQGTKDVLVPYPQAYEMAEALTKVNVRGRVELMLGMPHGWGGEEAQRTKAAAFAFFEEKLKAKK